MQERKITIICFVLILSAALLSGGCATPRQPAAELSRADAAIERARESGAGAEAPLDLRLAEEKLQRAKAETRDGSMEKARALAVEAELDARLAEEKARAEMAARNTERMRESVAELRRQIEENR
jgi:hypothetical protein